MIIRPCPFCGEPKDIDVGHGTPDREGTPTWLYCGNCGANGPWAYCKNNDVGEPTKKWNVRTTDNVFVGKEITRLRAELAKLDGQINRCVDQNKYLERLLAEAQRDVSIVTFLRCGGWEVLQNPKYWTPENKFFGAIAEAMADVAMEGK